MFPALKHLLMPRLKELDHLCKYTYNTSYTTVKEKLPHVSFETYLRSSEVQILVGISVFNTFSRG